MQVKVAKAVFRADERIRMLVLSRKYGESIQIGDDITITVVKIGPNAVRVGVTAPRATSVSRTELIQESSVEDRGSALGDEGPTEDT